MRPLVSVIVSVYNSEKYLVKTIETVLNQTLKDWELLLIDDKSTDNSVKIIKKYLRNKKIHLIESQTNNGAGPTRNIGIKKAKGKYICFLDADDLWERDKLEKQVNFMEKNNYVFTYTGYVFASKDGTPNGAVVHVPQKMSYNDYLKNTIIWTSTVMINQEYFNKEELYMPSLRRGQDGATWLNLLKKIDYAYGLDEILSFYRRTPNSLSSNKFQSIKRVWYLYRKYEKFNFFKSCYYFINYAFNTIKKRIK